MATTARLDLAVWRNDDVYELPLNVRGLDLSALSLVMDIRIGRDVPGAPLARLVKVTNGNAQGLRVASVTSDNGVPVSDLRIRLNKSTRQALPFTGEIGDDTPLEYALVIDGRTRLIGGITMLAHAYDADASPANRPPAYCASRRGAMPSSSATLTIAGNDVVNLVIEGADIALAAGERAESARDAAELAAASALASSRYFPTRAAGEAASTTGQLFSTDDGAGNVIYYRKTAGGSVEIGRALTPARLASSDGASLVGRIAPGDGAAARNVSLSLEDRGFSLADYHQAADGTNWSPAFGRLFDYLSTTRTANPAFPPWGVGVIKAPRGNLDLNTQPAFSASQVGFGIEGAGRFATVFSRSITTGSGYFLNPSGYTHFSDFTTINVTPDRGDSEAFTILGTNGGHMTTFNRIMIAGYHVGISVKGTTNGDFTHAIDAEFATDVGYTNNGNKNAVGALFTNNSFGCRQSFVRLGGAGEVSIHGGGGNVKKTVVEYMEGAGVAGIYPQSTLIHHHKLEYAAADVDGDPNDRLLIDGRASVLSPDNGGADTVTIFRDTTYALGDNPPGAPDGSSYDDHTIIALAGGRHRVLGIGGYLRGKIKYASNYLENRARWIFRNMRAAPLASRLELTGAGSHPLIYYQGNENVADQYRGGQTGTFSIQRGQAAIWRHDGFAIINTGVATNPFDQGGGVTRFGANFTIDLAAAPLDLPVLMTVEGLALYIKNNVNTTDTKVEWFSDNFVTLLDSATIPGGVRGKVQISTKDLTIIDGKLRVRITKPAQGDQGTIGALVIPYFPFFG